MGKKKKEKIGKSLRPKLTPMKTKHDDDDDDDDIDDDGLGFEDIALPIPICSPLHDDVFGEFNDNYSYAGIERIDDSEVIDSVVSGVSNSADEDEELIGSSAREETITNETSLSTFHSTRSAATYDNETIIKDMSMEFDESCK